MRDFKLKKPIVHTKHVVDVDGIQIAVPALYEKVEAMMVFFPADYSNAKKLIGDERVFPVKILPNTTVLAITIFDYLDAPVGPYREMAISIPSTIDRKIPILPLFFENLFKNFGFFAPLLVMNTRLGIKHSEEVYGYPSYQTPVGIDIGKENNMSISVYDNSSNIFSFEADFFKNYSYIENQQYSTFFKKEDKLLSVEMSVNAHVAEKNFPQGCKAVFGNHEISNVYFNNLITNQKPIKYIHYAAATEILSEPRPL